MSCEVPVRTFSSAYHPLQHNVLTLAHSKKRCPFTSRTRTQALSRPCLPVSMALVTVITIAATCTASVPSVGSLTAPLAPAEDSDRDAPRCKRRRHMMRAADPCRRARSRARAVTRSRSHAAIAFAAAQSAPAKASDSDREGQARARLPSLLLRWPSPPPPWGLRRRQLSQRE